MTFKFETANERWQQHLAESVPFLDPSELTDPGVAQQHQQNYDNVKQQISDLYQSFMSDQISIEDLAARISDAAKTYANKPVQY